MPLFRHHALLLAHEDLTSEALVGPVFRIRPSDGDSLPDRDQHWYVLFDLLREGDGVASASLATSFDGQVWHSVARICARNPQVVDLVEVPALAPFVRIETALQGDNLQHRVVARLASDGPFTVQPG
jgi:hypothetical protein